MSIRTGLILLAASFWAFGAGASAEERLQVEPRFAGERLVFTVSGAYTGYVLTVVGPEEYYARAEAARSAPTLRLRDHGAVPDGLYQWEMTAATNRVAPGAARVDQARNGREPGVAAPRIGARASGAFRVEDGRIMVFDELEEPTPGASQAG
ncbi:MAG: hypothetical protein ACFE0P_03245 [Oceanicaulis sp.]